MTQYVGTAVSRVDGRAKVTGAATYAAEFTAPGLLHASVVASAIACGRIVDIDTDKARAVDGVVDILTHLHRPWMAGEDSAYKDDVAPDGAPFRPLYDDQVWFHFQPVALVIAEEPEIARFAASLVRVTYDEQPHRTDLFQAREDAVPVAAPTTPIEAIFAPPAPRGQADRALAAAVSRHHGEYYVPIEHHNPMELYAATAVFEADGTLTLHDKTQGVQNVQRHVCGALGLKPDELRVVSPFVGGAFGSGLRPQYEAVLAALAARAVRRPVRLVLTRQQMYGLGYRPAMIQRIALAGTADGTLDAIAHDAVTVTSRYESYHRQETGWSGLLYTCANARYAHGLAALDLPTSCDMRAPSAATGVYALECAMDELAVTLGLDPLELRRRCYSDRDQINDRPYSSKALHDCYDRGARAFGWDRRTPAPRSMRDGGEFVGWGMATGVWEALQVPISVRITVTAHGQVEVACATSDIGTGTYTIMAQVAADALGLPLENIAIHLGDSTLPQSPVEGGSWIAASVSHGILTTAQAIRDELRPLSNDAALSPAAPITALMRAAGVERIAKEAQTTFADDGSRAHNTHSAVFVEVKVDEQLDVVRVTRVVSAVAGGRILNPKTAGSQIIGGVVWGIGMALHEETLIDHRFGRVMNADFAEYHVPTHADVPDIAVIFVDEPDPTINQLGVKGLGEIGIVGVAAAVANAVYHATGKRVRDLPITLDKLRR